MSPDLVFLGISLMIWGVGESMFFIFQPLYLQELGANSVTIGAVIGATGIAMAVAHIPAGYLADKVGRRPLLIAAWIIAVSATWIMALAPSFPVFVAGIIIYNITAFVSSPLSSYVTAARGKLKVERALTLVSAFYSFGAVFGPWLGGQVGQNFGLRTIYFIAGGLFIISSLFLVFIKDQPVDKSADRLTNNREIVNKKFVTYQAVFFLVGFSTYLSQPLSSNYLQNQQNLSLSLIGILGSIMSVGIVVLNLILGNLNAQSGYLLAQFAVGIFNILIWQGTSFAWYCLAYFLVGGFRVARSFATARTRNLVHQSQMGLAYGITETVGASAIILAAPVAGILYKVNPNSIYIVGFCMIILSMTVSARFFSSSN